MLNRVCFSISICHIVIMKKIWTSRKWLCLLFSILSCFLLIWCGSRSSVENRISIDVWDFSLEYAWNVQLSKVTLNKDDLSEITELYQEVWEDLEYRDSLLIAEKYAKWLWINAFVQDNLDILTQQWLELSNLKKTQIWLKWKKLNAVLVEYKITEWFIGEIPVLYMSQLFVPDWENVILLSFITENLSSANSASNMFKNIK